MDAASVYRWFEPRILSDPKSESPLMKLTTGICRPKDPFWTIKYATFSNFLKNIIIDFVSISCPGTGGNRSVLEVTCGCV